jgi:xanthine/uracil permease
MKYFAIVIIVIAFGLGVFNITKINTQAPFEGESIVALITLLASLCAIVLMLILLVSKRIEEKVKTRK